MDTVLHYPNGYGVKIVVNEDDTFTLTMLHKEDGTWKPQDTTTCTIEQLDHYLMIIRSKKP